VTLRDVEPRRIESPRIASRRVASRSGALVRMSADHSVEETSVANVLGVIPGAGGGVPGAREIIAYSGGNRQVCLLVTQPRAANSA